MIKKRSLFPAVFGMLVLSIIFSSPCFSTGNFINYQGKLTDSSGQAVNGLLAIDFSLWNDAFNTDPATGRIWQESQQVTVVDGVFNVRLGTVSSLYSIDFSDKDLFLQVDVEGTALEPRTPLATIPAAFWSYNAADSDMLGGSDAADYAKKSDLTAGSSGVAVDWSNLANMPAGFADGIDNIGQRNTLDAADGSPIGAVFVDNSGNVGIGLQTPSEKLQVLGNIAATQTVTAKRGEMNYLYVGSYMSAPYLEAGTIAVSGLVDGRDIAADGAVLDSLVVGSGGDTTNDAWTGTTDTYTTAGNVAIGTSDSEGNRLNVKGYSAGKSAVRGLDYRVVVGPPPYYLPTPYTYAEGLLGAVSPSGLPTTPGHIGVLGRKTASGDPGVGVYAWNNDDADENIALYARADGGKTDGVNYGVYATASGEGTNYAGYFDGDVKATGDIYVDGFINTNSFFIDSDSKYSVRISNSAANNSYAGWFESSGNNGHGVYGNAAATGSTDNYGGYFVASGDRGRGVYGKADATGNVENYGGYFESAGSHGFGGYFKATGDWGRGIYAEATGMEACYAAVFKGNVQILSHTSDLPVMELGEGLDYAEGFDVSDIEPVEPGTVLIIDPDNSGKLKMSTSAYDTKVAGVVAGANGLGSGVRLGTGQFDQDVALAGRVYCNVEASQEAIKPGDLLTTSNMPGYAMKATDAMRSQGAILGKAMEDLARGETAEILVLITLQ